MAHWGDIGGKWQDEDSDESFWDRPTTEGQFMVFVGVLAVLTFIVTILAVT